MNQQQLKIISNGLEQLAKHHDEEAERLLERQVLDNISRSFEQEKHEILAELFQGLHGCFYNAARVRD